MCKTATGRVLTASICVKKFQAQDKLERAVDGGGGGGGHRKSPR